MHTLPDVYILIYSGSKFYAPLRTLDNATKTLVLTAGAGIELTQNSGSRYYVENFAAACDSPG